MARALLPLVLFGHPWSELPGSQPRLWEPTKPRVWLRHTPPPRHTQALCLPCLILSLPLCPESPVPCQPSLPSPSSSLLLSPLNPPVTPALPVLCHPRPPSSCHPSPPPQSHQLSQSLQFPIISVLQSPDIPVLRVSSVLPAPQFPASPVLPVSPVRCHSSPPSPIVSSCQFSAGPCHPFPIIPVS